MSSTSKKADIGLKGASGPISWDFQENARDISAFMTGEKSSNAAAFLALVKEAGRFLKNFSPPDGFVPEKTAPPLSLPAGADRDLGAASLSDFFRLALEGEPQQEVPRSRVPEYFPQGPESIPPALTATDLEIKRLSKAIDDLERNWPSRKPGFDAEVRPKENRLAELRASRANLLRAFQELWPRMKKDSAAWPQEAKTLLEKAGRLEESVKLALRAAREGRPDQDGRRLENRSRRSLTRATLDLKTEIGTARQTQETALAWAEEMEALLSDLDDYLAVVVDGSQPNRDWTALTRQLSQRLTELEREEKSLHQASARASTSVKRCLAVLAETEKRLAGRVGSETLERLDSVGRGVQALLRGALDRRRELARIYFAVPGRLGRPVHLEKAFLASAVYLGRSQSLLEDMRHRLSLAGGRLSNTQRLRAEGEKLVEQLDHPPQRSGRLKVARERLSYLAWSMDQRLALGEVKAELEEVRLHGGLAQRNLLKSRSENNRLVRQLEAAGLERERLKEELALSRQNLGDSGRFKARVLAVVKGKTELLNHLEAERRTLAEENQALAAERNEVKAKRAKLAELYTRERGSLKRLSAELRQAQSDLAESQRLAEERRGVEEKLQTLRQERDELENRHKDLEAAFDEQNQRLADNSARSEALSAELMRHRAELSEAGRARQALGEAVSTLRRRLDRLVQARSSLEKTLARHKDGLEKSEADRERLKGKVNRQKRNILRLVGIRQELRAELGAARLKLADLEMQRDAIVDNLREVREHLQDSGGEMGALGEKLAELDGLEAQGLADLAPFIKILGEALWRNESQLKRARGASGRLMEQFKLEADVREANLRLQAAGREIELVESARSEQSRLEKELADKNSELARFALNIQELEEARDRLAGEKEALSSRNRELEESVARLDSRSQKLRRALDALKNRYDRRLGEMRLSEESLRELLASQGKELEKQKARLEELEPLVGHFFDVAIEESRNLTGPDGQPDLELAEYLKEESRAISAEYGGAAAAGAPETPAVSLLKARLAELQPLVAFLARSFVGTVAELAQARQERQQLAEALAEARRAQSSPGGPDLAEELENSRQQRRELAGELALARQENRTVLGELTLVKQERLELNEELARIRHDRQTLAGELTLSASTREILETSLNSREAELAEVRDQAFGLTREREQLQKSLEEKDGEINVLKSELAQADRDLAENDGRLEASWAALNYLGSRAGDAVANMKNKLENQVRQVDNLSLELKKREEKIKGLEKRQDKLALLYWTLVSQAAAGSGPDLPQLPAPLPVPAITGAATAEPAPENLQEDQARNSGGHSLGRELLEGVKKVARRSLFTLILAGGMVMAGPPSGALAGLAPGGFSVPAASEAAGESESLPSHLLAHIDSSYIGRSVSLEEVEAAPRLAGRPAVENRLAEKVEELAGGHGLSTGEFLRLVRTARGPEHTVHLSDFAGREGALALLEPHAPKLTRHLRAWPADLASPARLTTLMKCAADFKKMEGAFWERLFFDFLAAGDAGRALDMLLEHLEQKSDLLRLPRPEYAGRLAPFPQIENLGPDRFIGFMADYIKKNWPAPSGRGRDQAANRLAGDIYYAARLFKQPVTLFAALSQEEAERRELDFFRRGGTTLLHKLAADLADLAQNSSVVWQEGKAPLCDLDEALAAYENKAFVEAVYRRKMALVQAHNKVLNAGSSLLDGLEDDERMS